MTCFVDSSRWNTGLKKSLESKFIMRPRTSECLSLIVASGQRWSRVHVCLLLAQSTLNRSQVASGPAALSGRHSVLLPFAPETFCCPSLFNLNPPADLIRLAIAGCFVFMRQTFASKRQFWCCSPQSSHKFLMHCAPQNIECCEGSKEPLENF